MFQLLKEKKKVRHDKDNLVLPSVMIQWDGDLGAMSGSKVNVYQRFITKIVTLVARVCRYQC